MGNNLTVIIIIIIMNQFKNSISKLPGCELRSMYTLLEKTIFSRDSFNALKEEEEEERKKKALGHPCTSSCYKCVIHRSFCVYYSLFRFGS